MKAWRVLPTIAAFVGLVAAPASAGIDQVRVKIAGYLCGF
jgi:hypothetical protein